MWWVIVFHTTPLPRVFGPYTSPLAAQAALRQLVDTEGLDEDMLVVVKMEQR